MEEVAEAAKLSTQVTWKIGKDAQFFEKWPKQFPSQKIYIKAQVESSNISNFCNPPYFRMAY